MKRQALLMNLVLFTAGLLIAAEATAGDSRHSDTWREDSCFANCVSMSRHHDLLLFTGKGASGQVVATAWARVGASARGPLSLETAKADVAAQPTPETKLHSSLPDTGTCIGTTGTCIDHSVFRYETTTHLIIVTVTYYFFNGELHDIDVREKRFAKNKIN